MAEKKNKVKSAQDQVGGKVNAGIMDAVCTNFSMCENSATPEKTEYQLGFEEPVDMCSYAHVNEGKERSNKLLKYYSHYIKLLFDFMVGIGEAVKPMPKILLINKKQKGSVILHKTGYYDPNEKKIVIFIYNRNPKDILKTFSHEIIHARQDAEGRLKLGDYNGEKIINDDKLKKLEEEAYLKGNIAFRSWTEHMQETGELNESFFHPNKNMITESTANEMIKPEDVDLSSFEIQDELNPKFWKDEHLDSRIRMKLFDIADDFMEEIGIDDSDVEDIIITGSLANYNWNKDYSDIDLHIVVDFNDFDTDKEILKKYFDAAKREWNERHKNLKIYGFTVEVYVQDINEPHKSTGVYSIEKDKWLREPDEGELSDENLNKEKIRNTVSELTDKIDKISILVKKAGNDEYKLRKLNVKAKKLWDSIKEIRSKGLTEENPEMSNGNIIFKSLRRNGYLDKLFNLKSKIYDKMNSL